MQRSLKVPERKRQQRLIDFGLQEYVAAALMPVSYTHLTLPTTPYV